VIARDGSMPLVTVIMPAFNAAAHLAEAIDSVLEQSFRDFELLVVDDGSTDRTSEVLASYGDRIRTLRQTNSGSPAAARNSGIRNAATKYVAFFDADDVMDRDQLLNSVTVMDYSDQACLCFSNFQPFGPGVVDGRPWFQREHVRSVMSGVPTEAITDHLYLCARPVFAELVQSNYIHTSTVMVRRDALLEHNAFDESLYGVEDWDLWLRLARAGHRFGFCSTVMSHYRIQSASVSRSTAFERSLIDLLNRLSSQDPDRDVQRVLHRRLSAKYRDYGWALRMEADYPNAMRSYTKGLLLAGRRANGGDVCRSVADIAKTAVLWANDSVRGRR